MNAIAAERCHALESAPAAVVNDPRWIAAERIVGSQNFSKSMRLNMFLVHIVRCAIEERTEELSEQQIGVQVFGRSPGYNPSEDNIVRTTARQLRQRLALYYQEEGRADPIRIEVPRGGYVPVFKSGEERSADLQIVHPEPASNSQQLFTASAPLAAAAPKRIFGSWLSAVTLLLLGAALALAIQGGVSVLRLRASATDQLWRTLFSSKQTTIFIPGDAGLNMFNNQAHAARQVALSDYIGGKYLYSPKAQSPEFAGVPIASRRYVNITDLLLADRFAMLARIRRENYQIRFPRDLMPEDFRNRNVILSGAPVYNPWDELFDERLNFHIVYDGEGNSMFIENRKPLAGEQSVYDTNWKRVFGYIALTDNLDNNGKVLLIEGTSHVGVEAAYAFLFNGKKMAPILAAAKKSDGSLANFEVLLDAASINNSESGDIEVLAKRIYSAASP